MKTFGTILTDLVLFIFILMPYIDLHKFIAILELVDFEIGWKVYQSYSMGERNVWCLDSDQTRTKYTFPVDTIIHLQ